MRIKLTKTAIEKLTPSQRPHETYDTEIRGLLLRVQPGGQKTWYLRYRLPTGRRRIKLGAYPGLSPDGARTVAQRHLGEVAAGVDVQQRKQEERARAEVERSSVLGVFVETAYGPWCRANLKTGARSAPVCGAGKARARHARGARTVQRVEGRAGDGCA